MNAVPVWLGYRYAGLAYCEGILRDEGEYLVLEYQTKEALIGDMLRSNVREAHIPRDTLSSVTLRSIWFGHKSELVIQTNKMEPVADVPGMSRGQLALRVAQKDQPIAEKFVADLRLPGSLPAKPALVDTGLD